MNKNYGGLTTIFLMNFSTFTILLQFIKNIFKIKEYNANVK